MTVLLLFQRSRVQEADVGKDGKVAWDDFLALMRSPPDGLTTEQEGKKPITNASVVMPSFFIFGLVCSFLFCLYACLVVFVVCLVVFFSPSVRPCDCSLLSL